MGGRSHDLLLCLCLRVGLENVIWRCWHRSYILTDEVIPFVFPFLSVISYAKIYTLRKMKLNKKEEKGILKEEEEGGPMDV